MNVAEQVEALKSRHAELEKVLEDEIGRPPPDQGVMGGLMKQKLRIMNHDLNR